MHVRVREDCEGGLCLCLLVLSCDTIKPASLKYRLGLSDWHLKVVVPNCCLDSQFAGDYNSHHHLKGEKAAQTQFNSV